MNTIGELFKDTYKSRIILSSYHQPSTVYQKICIYSEKWIFRKINLKFIKISKQWQNNSI